MNRLVVSDLRNSNQELRHLQHCIARARLEDDWRALNRLLILEEAPQAAYAVATESLNTFHLVDQWTGSRLVILASLIRRTIENDGLGTLRTPDLVTSHGAPVGRQYQQNRVRGALSVQKAREASSSLLVVPLALLIVALQGREADRVPLGWIESICGVVHNHSQADWTAFLSSCSQVLQAMPTWHTAVQWAATFEPPHRKLRSAEQKFCNALNGLGKFLAGKLPSGKALHYTTLTSLTLGKHRDVRAREPDDIIDPIDIVSRELEFHVSATRQSVEEAEEPETTLVAKADATPVDEPDAHEGFQRAETIRGAFRSAFDNQHLEFHWDSLLPQEVTALIQKIEFDLRSQESALALPAMACATAICLGRRPYEFWKLWCGWNEHCDIDLRLGVFTKTVPRPPQSWHPDDKRPISLQPSTEFIAFSIPTSLATAFHRWLPTDQFDRATIMDALGFSTEQYSGWLRDWLKVARADKHRLTS